MQQPQKRVREILTEASGKDLTGNPACHSSGFLVSQIYYSMEYPMRGIPLNYIDSASHTHHLPGRFLRNCIP